MEDIVSFVCKFLPTNKEIISFLSISKFYYQCLKSIVFLHLVKLNKRPSKHHHFKNVNLNLSHSPSVIKPIHSQNLKLHTTNNNVQNEYQVFLSSRCKSLSINLEYFTNVFLHHTLGIQHLCLKNTSTNLPNNLTSLNIEGDYLYPSIEQTSLTCLQHLVLTLPYRLESLSFANHQVLKHIRIEGVLKNLYLPSSATYVRCFKTKIVCHKNTLLEHLVCSKLNKLYLENQRKLQFPKLTYLETNFIPNDVSLPILKTLKIESHKKQYNVRIPCNVSIALIFGKIETLSIPYNLKCLYFNNTQMKINGEKTLRSKSILDIHNNIFKYEY